MLTALCSPIQGLLGVRLQWKGVETGRKAEGGEGKDMKDRRGREKRKDGRRKEEGMRKGGRGSEEGRQTCN